MVLVLHLDYLWIIIFHSFEHCFRGFLYWCFFHIFNLFIFIITAVHYLILCYNWFGEIIQTLLPIWWHHTDHCTFSLLTIFTIISLYWKRTSIISFLLMINWFYYTLYFVLFLLLLWLLFSFFYYRCLCIVMMYILHIVAYLNFILIFCPFQFLRFCFIDIGIS